MNVETTLRERLLDRFKPQHMELDNESHQHSVPANAETHFRLVLVSDAFEGQRPVARHQQVYGEVPDLLQGPVHAMAMHLFTPQEWQDRAEQAAASPDCLGGSKAEGEMSA